MVKTNFDGSQFTEEQIVAFTAAGQWPPSPDGIVFVKEMDADPEAVKDFASAVARILPPQLAGKLREIFNLG